MVSTETTQFAADELERLYNLTAKQSARIAELEAALRAARSDILAEFYGAALMAIDKALKRDEQ